MKAKKLLGSVALTAALAMGTMPAFATVSSTAPTDGWNGADQGIANPGVSNTMNVFNVTGDNTRDPGNDKVGVGQTQVRATVFDADCNVTVPMIVSVAFSTKGGELTCPNANAYQIYNNSDQKDVQITNILGAAGSGWTLKGSAQSTQSSGMQELVKDFDADTMATPDGKYYVGLSLKLGSNTYDLYDLSKKATPGDLGAANAVTIAKAANASTPTGQPIELKGLTNKFQTPLANAGWLAGNLATITYTVATV